MTEAEYEEWFDKYLSDVESLDKPYIEKSPFSHIPKPLKRNRWIIVCVIALAGSIGASFALSYKYEITGFWAWNWGSNALLNLAIGLIASLLIMTYTNVKDRNIAFYSDLLPLLEKRLQDMRKAYYDFTFKIHREFLKGDLEKCYQAWHANSNTCYVILEFLRYLNKAFPFRPSSLEISEEEIEIIEKRISEANNLMQSEFLKEGTISKETEEVCRRAADFGVVGLNCIESLIYELKYNLYGIKYGKTAKGLKDIDDVETK